MKKILFVIIDFKIGGAQNALIKHINLLNSEKYNIIVVSLTGLGEEYQNIENKNIEVYNLNIRKNLISIFKIYDLYKYIKKLSPDIIHSWMYHADLIGGIVGKFANVPKIIWGVRSADFLTENTNFTLKLVFKMCALVSGKVPDLVVYNSQKGLNFHQALGYSSCKSEVIYNWIDCDEFKPRTFSKRMLLKKLNVKGNKKLIGHVARLDPLKNHLGFIEFAYQLSSLSDDYVFIMIGEGVSSSDSIIKSIIEHKIENKVYILPKCNKINKIMPAFDGTVITSFSEAFPNVMIESLACGVPCFSTLVGDAKQINYNEDWVINSFSMEELAGACHRHFELGPEIRMEISSKLVKYCKTNFGSLSYSKMYNEHYNF